MPLHPNTVTSRRPGPALVILLTLGAAGQAEAQCVDCAQQMYSATLQNNVSSASADVRKLDLQNHDRDVYLRPSNPKRSTSPSVAQKNALGPEGKAAIAIFMPEYSRRVKSEGKAGADRWLYASARELGRQAGLKARAGAARR